MMHGQLLLTIRQLVERSGVSSRTIRYYTTEGLLPPPEARGRYALYSEQHLLRLALITRLKDAYLPLRSIRTQLQNLTDEQVASLLSSSEQSENYPVPTDLQEILAEDGAEANLQTLARFLEKAGEVQPETASELNQTQITSENWQRVMLETGIELHLKLPLSSPQISFLEQMLTLIGKGH